MIKRNNINWIYFWATCMIELMYSRPRKIIQQLIQRRNVIGAKCVGGTRQRLELFVSCTSVCVFRSLCPLRSRSEQCNYKTELMSASAQQRIHKGSIEPQPPLRANISSWSRRNARAFLTCLAPQRNLCSFHAWWRRRPATARTFVTACTSTQQSVTHRSYFINRPRDEFLYWRWENSTSLENVERIKVCSFESYQTATDSKFVGWLQLGRDSLDSL